MPYLRHDDPSMLCALGVVPATAPIGATTMEAMGHDRRPGWPDLVVIAVHGQREDLFLPTGHSCGSAATFPSGGHDRRMGRRRRLLPRLPDDGTWSVQHEGFTSGP